MGHLLYMQLNFILEILCAKKYLETTGILHSQYSLKTKALLPLIPFCGLICWSEVEGLDRAAEAAELVSGVTKQRGTQVGEKANTKSC